MEKLLRPRVWRYEDIQAGDVFSFRRKIDEALVEKFAELTHDYNPLHIEEDYAGRSEFGGRIAQGMLLASLFSALVGMHCPGKSSLYLSQKVNFRKPLKIGEEVEVRGEVVSKSDALKIIELKTTIADLHNTLIVDGVARVKVREDLRNLNPDV